jgi:glutamate synthase domain-containing protein 3
MSTTADATIFDLAQGKLRDLNARLHEGQGGVWRISNPNGAHNIAVGLDAEMDVEIDGHAGYYCAGMNQHAVVRVQGNVGVGVGENMMSGRVEVFGDASQSAGATAHGGLLVVHGSASARCGISLKGADIVVHGSIGHMGAFMAQSGRLVVCGDAGDALGDSIYEAELYVRGSVASLGADCVEREMTEAQITSLSELLADAGADADARDFRCYGSARELYTFHPDDAGDYR